MKTSIIILLTTFISFSLYSQKATIKWGKISEEELAMTNYEYDAEAEAVVLFDKGILSLVESDRGFDYRLNRTRRIKILKESGLERGNIFLPYYHGSGREKIKNVDAHVFSSEGKTQSISKKEVFTEEKSEYWSSKNFSIPNLQVGSVFEYRYELNATDITHLKEWYFQEDIPVAHSELQITIPKYFEYIFLLNGYELTIAPQNQNASDYGSSLKIESANNPFILKNVPAISEENYITCMEDYLLGIRFQLNTIHYPNGITESVLNSWEETAKEMEEHRYLGKQYKTSKNYKKLLAKIQPKLEGLNSDLEKVNAAASFLRLHLKSTGYNNYMASDILDRLFEKGEVHSGDLNLMLMAILHANQIPVYPLLISTRSHGRMITSHPIIDQFNHLLVYAVIDGKETILDLGDPLRPITIPRKSALNHLGWLINGANSKWIDINAPNSKQVIMANMSRNEQGEMEGNLKGKYSGYAALNERIEHQEDQNGLYWKERLNNISTDAVITNFQTKNADNVDIDFRDEFDCTLPDAIQESGDFLYLKPILYSDFFENPLKLNNRFYPIDINFPIKEQYILNFNIPEGYEVESLPESLNLVLFEKAAQLSYKFQTANNKITLTYLLQVNQLQYSPLEYVEMKSFFDQVTEKIQELVVLKKK